MADQRRGGSEIRSEERPRSHRPRESDWIGKKLHQVYGEALAEPIPADLMALIEKIDANTNEKSGS